MKVVCIEAVVDFPAIVRGEIYSVASMGRCPRCKRDEYIIPEIEYPHLRFPLAGGRVECECGWIGPYYCGFPIKKFRPVDDTFGEVVAEIIEKQLELETVEA